MEKPDKEFLKKFWDTIGEAYDPDVFPTSRKQALKHEVGDLLADFIRVEIEEVIEGEETRVDIVESAHRAMDRAITQLEAVRYVLDDLLFVEVRDNE